jgi:hypothetical protein
VPTASQGHCWRPRPTPGVDQVFFGRNIDDALYCTDALYEGPDGLPLDKMLEGAARELVRVFPDVQIVAQDRRVTLMASSRTLAVGPVFDTQALTLALVQIAAFGRSAISPFLFGIAGSPEHVLVQGALGALEWDTRFRPPVGEPLAISSKAHVSHPDVQNEAGMLDGILYLRLAHHDKGVAGDVRQLHMQHSPTRGVILDLRGSTGGLLAESLALADVFLRRGCIGATRQSLHVESSRAQDQPGDVDEPVVVLIDHFTASGAELVAATLRANGRAILLGERSFGNAVIRVLLDLESGGFALIPIAELVSGDGFSFHAQGVQPDFAVPETAPPSAAAHPFVEFARQVLLHTKSRDRADLLKAAAALGARPAVRSPNPS